MTHDEIQKMVGHKLDATIQRGLMDPIPHGMVPATIAPSYHDDLNACHAAEEGLAEMGLTRSRTLSLDLLDRLQTPQLMMLWRVDP